VENGIGIPLHGPLKGFRLRFIVKQGTESSPRPLIIESHAHVYSPDEWRFPPRPDASRPSVGVGTLDHLIRTCEDNGIAAVVVIQTGTFYGWDNRYLAHLSSTESGWIAGVCALSAEDPRSPHLLREYVRDQSVRGVRILAASSGHLDVPEVRSLWAAAADLGLVVNVLASTAHLDEVSSLLQRFPSTPAVIEHGLAINRSATADDRSATIRESVSALRILAESSNAVVELCDLPSVSAEPYPFADAHEPYLQIIDAFGPERCVWGSCFPTEFWVQKASQKQSIDIYAQVLPLAENARRQILGLTAARLWFPDLVPKL
jgi:L-fuconolactonase